MPEGLSSVLRLCSLDHRKLSPKTLGAAAPGGSHRVTWGADVFRYALELSFVWTKICQTILLKSDTFGHFQPNWLSFAGLTGHSIWECLGFQKKRALIRSLTVLIVLIVCSIPKFTDKETPPKANMMLVDFMEQAEPDRDEWILCWFVLFNSSHAFPVDGPCSPCQFHETSVLKSLLCRRSLCLPT